MPVARQRGHRSLLLLRQHYLHAEEKASQNILSPQKATKLSRPEAEERLTRLR